MLSAYHESGTGLGTSYLVFHLILPAPYEMSAMILILQRRKFRFRELLLTEAYTNGKWQSQNLIPALLDAKDFALFPSASYRTFGLNFSFLCQSVAQVFSQSLGSILLIKQLY